VTAPELDVCFHTCLCFCINDIVQWWLTCVALYRSSFVQDVFVERVSMHVCVCVRTYVCVSAGQKLTSWWNVHVSVCSMLCDGWSAMSGLAGGMRLSCISMLPYRQSALSGLAGGMWLTCISVLPNQWSALISFADGMWLSCISVLPSECCPNGDQPWAVFSVGCDCHVSVYCYQHVVQMAIGFERSCRWDVIVMYKCVAQPVISLLLVRCDCHV